MKKRFFDKTRKKIAFVLAGAMTLSLAGNVCFKNDEDDVVKAAQVDTVYFAQGLGTGNDFSTESWEFYGNGLDQGSETNYNLSSKDNGKYMPAIVPNDHTSEQEAVIRLIQGVKENGTTGYESNDSFTDFRSGQAYVKQGFTLDDLSRFSLKFTFSMPDAVVNSTQAGGDQYAREFGGDGISFIMTTGKKDAGAGSGIGYQGIKNSVAVEMDSFYNGAYCFMGSSGTAIPNWEFDNQLYIHKDWQYNRGAIDENNPAPNSVILSPESISSLEAKNALVHPDYKGGIKYWYSNDTNPYESGMNADRAYRMSGTFEQYVNYNHSERFDHIGITLDGEVKKHEAIKYINKFTTSTNGHSVGDEIIPNELTIKKNGAGVTGTCGEYKNLAYWGDDSAETKKGKLTDTNRESSSNDCSTRFADKNVDNRLFTAWVEYDGTTMTVSVANGSFTEANRNSAITTSANIDLASKFGGKPVFLGFTSAVGTSKANHTIHGVEFVNKYIPEGLTSNASYNVEYYYQTGVDASDNPVYEKDSDKSLVISKDVNGVSVKVGDTATSSGTAYKDGTTSYANYIQYGEKTNYSYENVPGKTIDSITVTSDNKATLKLYYNKQTAYYKLHFFKGDLEGNYSEVSELMVPGATSPGIKGFVGQTYTASDAKPGFEDYFIASNPGYGYNSAHPSDKSSVILETAGETYDMNVYFAPTPATYTIRYHKWNPVTNTEVGSADIPSSKNKVPALVGSTIAVDESLTSADTNYKDHFVTDGYVFYNASTNNKMSTTIVAGDDNYLDLYYIPKSVTYTVKYWKLDPNAPTDKSSAVEDTSARHDEDGYIGYEYYVSDTDASYKTKYDSDNYEFSSVISGSDNPSVTLTDSDNVINVYYVPKKTYYSIEFYKDLDGNGTYTKVTEDTIGGSGDSNYEVFIASSKTINTADYANKYTSFVMTNVDGKTVTSIAAMDIDASKNVFKLYYVPKKTSYVLKYFLYDVNSGKPVTDTTGYKPATPASSSVVEGIVGNTYEATDADATYVNKFDSQGFILSEGTINKLSTGALTDGNMAVMEAYYVPKNVKYAIRYFKQNEDGTYPGIPTEESEPRTGMWGTTHDADEFDPDYEEKYEEYKIDPTKPLPLITLTPDDEIQYIDVYYEPINVNYEIHYWKYDVNAKQFVEVIADKKSGKGLLNSTVKVSDVDTGYVNKYSTTGYDYDEGNTDEILSKKLENAGQTYHMHVYYDLPKVSYTVNYYKLNKETDEYEKVVQDTKVKEDRLTTTHRINDADVDPAYETKYDGYSVNKEKDDEYEVTLIDKDGTYVINVYYDPVVTPPAPEPSKGKYKINYFKKNKTTGVYEKTSDSTEVVEVELNTVVKIQDIDVNYESKYVDEKYGINNDVEGKIYEVTVKDKNIIYELNVFYDPVYKYIEKYWIESPDATEDYVIININGEDRKFILAETSDDIDAFAGDEVTVTDKSDEYPDYELVTVELPDYPSVDNVDTDGKTVVHQVYILKDDNSQDPQDPTEPNDPEEPENPEDPEDPQDPSDPEEPETPDDTIEPEDPTDPDDIVEPDEPEEPDDPAETEEPEESEDPASGSTSDTNTFGIMLSLITLLGMAIFGTYYFAVKRRKVR